jgi:hypothetical protein
MLKPDCKFGETEPVNINALAVINAARHEAKVLTSAVSVLGDCHVVLLSSVGWLLSL